VPKSRTPTSINRKRWKRFHCIKCDTEKTYPKLESRYPGYDVMCPECDRRLGHVSYSEGIKIHDRNMMKGEK